MKGHVLAIAIVCALITARGFAVGTPGLAAAYPRDVGIETDPAVLFTEQFEEADLATLFARWTSTLPNTMSFGADVPSGSELGSHSLTVPSTSTDTGGALFKGLSAYQTRMYVRFYIKYQSGDAPHHSGVWIGGEKVPTPPGPFFPDPHAGVRPCSLATCAGLGQTPWFWNSSEQQPDLQGGIFDSYTAFQNMRTDGDGINGTPYGNLLTNNLSLMIPDDTWTCVEHMIKVNTIGDTDGELQIWVNGTSVSHLGKGFPTGTWNGGRFTQGAGSAFEGLQWRDDSAFGGLNWIWLQNYSDVLVTTVKFDHVVAATSYIGCLGDDTRRRIRFRV